MARETKQPLGFQSPLHLLPYTVRHLQDNISYCKKLEMQSKGKLYIVKK